MAIYKTNMVDIDLGKGQIHRAFLNHSIGTQDQQADRFGIRVFRDKEPVNLTGVTVQGVFMPPQGSPIAITGSTYTHIDGNTAEVILPQACYNYEGNFTLAIKLVDATNAVTGTMRIVDGMVDNTHASGTVAPTGSVPTYQEVLAVYDELLQDVTDYESVVANQNAKIDDLKSALSFYNFGLFDGRIDWDTTNNTVTLGTGFFIYGGYYHRVNPAVTLAYTNFNNTTVLVYNGSAFSFVPFNGLINGTALALFNGNKMYTPFSYDKVYLNGNKITTANLFNDFVPFIDSIAQDVDDISTEIEAINDKLDAFFPETVVYDENNETSSSATSDSIWIPKELTIPANVIVTTIDVYVKNDTQKTFSISFWNSETGEKYADKTYTITPSQNVVSIPINIQTTSPTKIGFYSASAFATVTGKNGYNLLYVEPSATSILNAPTAAKWVLNATVKAIVVDQDDTRVLSQEIHVGDGLAFTEIQQAIESVIGDYATIIVHPKSTPYGRFSLMRSLGGSYPWSGLTSVKHISIIGVDKTKCIVQSNTGNYDTPPAEIATNGIIKNLTFIATHTASDGTETTGSYAVHVDNRPADANGMKLVFENCDFISYQTAAVGLGLYRNQDILFDHCNFKSYTDSTWKPNENYDSAYLCALGAYFMHTTMGYAGGNMFIRFKDCLLYHEGGSYAMRIADADETQTALLEAINNTLWDATNGNTGYYTTNHPIMQMPYNHGNNAVGLNA